ncbi:retrovirus-related pol polyprotein from transposon TNT 1-94 [Tanacetum coccineum]
MENYKNMSQDIRNQLDAKAEAVQIILTWINNKIYSTVDACPNACEMWKAVGRLKQDGESLESYYSRFYKMTNELIRNKCEVTNHQVNVQFLLQLQPEWQRFVTLVMQSQELKTVSYHKLYDILKQHQNEVNEIRAERLAHTTNPLELVVQQKPVYHPQNHPNHCHQNSSTRSQQAATKNKGKAIVNSTYDQEPDMEIEDDEMSKGKEIDKLMALIFLSFKKIYKPTNNNLRTSSNTSRANQDNSLIIKGHIKLLGLGRMECQKLIWAHKVVGAWENVGTQVVYQSGIQCYNCKEYGHVARECQKLKWVKDATYHKEKMLLCKQEEAGFQLNAEQDDWRDDNDDEPEDQELEAHYMYMAQIQEVTLDVADNSGPIFDAKPLQKVQINKDNYNVFAIESKHPEQPESVNDTYPVKQDEHNIIIDSLDMSCDREQDDQDDNDDLAKERDLLASLIMKLKCEINDSKNHNKFLETSNKALVDKLKGAIEDFKAKNKNLESSNNHFKEANNELSKTNQLMFKDLKKFQAELDRINADLENFYLCLKEEMVADLRYSNSLEHEVDSLKSQLETQKTQFLNEIDRLSREYYYADHMNAILGVYTTLDEFTDLQCDYVDQVVKCECLEKELSKSNITSKSFKALQQHAIDLELALQQCQEQIKNDKAFKENQSKVFLKEREQYFEIQDLKAQLQDKGIAISELKKLIEKMKGKSVETKFEKPSVIRQPNAFKSQRQSVLGKPATFLDSLAKTDFSKSKSVTTNNVSNDFSKPVTA